jgi:sterol desaturase/sphingolipid hydroxylase (fatty acid hydroxylase superfamily)
MGVGEALLPRRDRVASQGRRWFTNLFIAGIDTAVLRIIFPVAAVGFAVWAQAKGYGLFNVTGLPPLLEGLIAFLALDFAIYVQHVASHKIQVLWRLHQVHHADPDIDVSTGIRFHPVEILLSMGYKLIVVTALGAPPAAVFAFEVVLNGGALFNHANLKLPLWLDRILRLLIVTPDMHRVHHSVIWRETDSNYGFNLSIWDRMFGTYVAQPKEGHEGMTIGLKQHGREQPVRLGWSLLIPFRGVARRQQPTQPAKPAEPAQ